LFGLLREVISISSAILREKAQGGKIAWRSHMFVEGYVAPASTAMVRDSGVEEEEGS
jgi:hypothetical protein